MSAFARQIMSGATFSFWQANILPVLPKPVATSSAIRSAPYFSVSFFSSFKKPGGWTMIPAAP